MAFIFRAFGPCDRRDFGDFVVRRPGENRSGAPDTDEATIGRETARLAERAAEAYATG